MQTEKLGQNVDIKNSSKKISSNLEARAQKIAKNTTFWLRLAVLLGLLMFCVGVASVWLVVFRVNQGGNDNLGVAFKAWVTRISLLVPFAWLLFFSLSRYRAERTLEEEYSFKAMVVEILPDYVSNWSDQETRSSVIKTATSTLFSSPSTHIADVKLKGAIEGLKNLTEIISNIRR